MPANTIPQNLQAERAVIGACLLSADALGIISEILRPDDFYDANNKTVYEICLSMYFENKPIDMVTFQAEATSRNAFERLGGQPFLAELVSDDMLPANASYYAEIVKDASTRRKMLDAGQKITTLAVKPDVEARELVGEAEKIILDASAEKDTSGPVALQSAVPSVLAKIEELRTGKRRNTGYKSGFKGIDGYVGGFQPGTLNIIAARPSMGKTALALNIAQFGGEGNRHVLFFSLEMSVEQLVHRMLSAETLRFGEGVGISAMTSGELSEDDVYAIGRAEPSLRAHNIHICDRSELSAMDFRTECRRFKTRHPDLALIVVDYLQLMSSGKKSDTRQYEVAEISRMMKSTAVELECPVIALSQLSRETEKRTDKKPQLSDLRDSGAIEQDADVVMMLFREDYYTETENNDLTDSKADIRIAKNRNGTTGVCHLTFERKFTRFMDYGG